MGQQKRANLHDITPGSEPGFTPSKDTSRMDISILEKSLI